MTKRCFSCKNYKELSEFYADKSKSSGCGGECKDCQKKRGREDYIKNKTAIRERNRRYYLTHKEQAAAYHKKHNLIPANKKRAYERAIRCRNKKLEWFLSHIGTDRLRCDMCGYNKSFAAIQFHHTNPGEKENPKDNFARWHRSMSMENFQKKVLSTTFDILCANCHAEIHSNERVVEPC